MIFRSDGWQIRRFKRVSRIWRDMIAGSKAVQQTQVLHACWREHHDVYVNNANDFWNFVEADENIAIYTSTDWVRVNPAFRQLSAELNQYVIDSSAYHITIVLPTEGMPSHSDEYVTHPPVAQITISTYRWDPVLEAWDTHCNANICTAYNPTGLKVSDLMAARDTMRSTQWTCFGPDPHPIDVMVHARLQIHGFNSNCHSQEDTELDKMYFQSFLPRYRKPYDETRFDFEKIKHMDRKFDWHLFMEVDSELDTSHYMWELSR